MGTSPITLSCLLLSVITRSLQPSGSQMGGAFWDGGHALAHPRAGCTSPSHEAERELKRMCAHMPCENGYAYESVMRAMEGPEGERMQCAHARIRGEPPTTPNCFTDGSVERKRDLACAFAGYGVWIPSSAGGSTDMHMWGGDCLLYAHGEHTDRGTALWGYLTGRRPSSTRAEVAGILASLLATIPLHIACDNAAAVRTFSRLTRGVLRLDRRPWGLRSNGDLWSQVHAAWSAKGEATVTISKCKGHADDKDVAEGRSTPHLRAGNQAADMYAERGRLARPATEHVLAWIAAQRQHYTVFMHAVQDMMLCIFRDMAFHAADPLVKDRGLLKHARAPNSSAYGGNSMFSAGAKRFWPRPGRPKLASPMLWSPGSSANNG